MNLMRNSCALYRDPDTAAAHSVEPGCAELSGTRFSEAISFAAGKGRRIPIDLPYPYADVPGSFIRYAYLSIFLRSRKCAQ